MCYVWEGKIERCPNCSESHFQTVLRIMWNMELARPTDQLFARITQNHSNQGRPQGFRHDARMNLLKDPANETVRNQEQGLTHQARPFSLRHDVPTNQTVQNKRQKTNEDSASSSTYVAPSNGTAQHKWQNPGTDQQYSSIHSAGHAGAAQHRQQGMNAVQACSSRQGARTTGTAYMEQQAKDQGVSSSSIHDARSDWANGRGRKESHQDLPSSSRPNAITDLTGKEQNPGASRKASQNDPRVVGMEASTPGLELPALPSWEDARVFVPLVQEQLSQEEFYRRQEQVLDDIWGPYAKEREELAAVHTPEPEEVWMPEFEEAEILEREIPLEKEIWARSVLAGEDWMRIILDEGEDWPRQPPEEPNIWTRDEGGNLDSVYLRRLTRVLTLEGSLKEG